MTNRIIPFGFLAAIIIGVLAALTVAGAFGGDDGPDGAGGDGEQVESAPLCIEGAEDCEDVIIVPGGDDEDVADAPPPEGGAGDDVAVSPPRDGDAGETPPDLDDSEALAVEAAYAALEEMGGPPAAEVDVSGVESVTWNDSCLGVHRESVACAQVITPGYVVFLSGPDGDYEFHTDTRGNAVFAQREWSVQPDSGE